MATTKTAEKKPAVKKGKATAAEEPIAQLADEVLMTQIHRAMVRIGDAARISEILREIGDETVSAGLVRHTLEAHPRNFVSVDRRWDITQRYLDKQRPVNRTLEELVANYGAPIPVEEAATELAAIYSRVKEHFEEVAPRMLLGANFFPINKGAAYGLRSWLLNIENPAEADLIFYNYLTAESLAPYQAGAKGLDWETDPAASANALITAAGENTIDNRVIQYFAWKSLDEDFDGPALYEALANSTELFLALPAHRWLSIDALAEIRTYWSKRSEEIGDIVEEAIPEAVNIEPAKPLEVTGADLAELRKLFYGHEDAVTVGDLLTNVFEVNPGSPSYQADSKILIEFMREQTEDFAWIGTDRFRAPATLPPYLGQIPESLTFPILPRFETADGEILDQMLSDQAFDEGLTDDLLYSVAQDVNDQEPQERTRWPEGVSADSPWLRLVLKSHHKEIGTFPLSQVPRGFFPPEPSIVELSLRDSAGNAYPIYIDYNVQLVYGLFDVYANIAAESGAVFHLEKTDKPSEYKFSYNNETDSAVFVNPNRFADLGEYRTVVESSHVSTYDIVRHILDHYRKGCSFLTLLTEVNIVRRTPRRLLASVLSSYTAFHERANRWTFDPKKEPEGFDKRKAPYIIKK